MTNPGGGAGSKTKVEAGLATRVTTSRGRGATRVNVKTSKPKGFNTGASVKATRATMKRRGMLGPEHTHANVRKFGTNPGKKVGRKRGKKKSA